MPTVSNKRLAVRVNDDALRWIRSGHPWLYENSIVSVSGDGVAGDLAVIFDRKRAFQAIGLYDPTSPIRVKILHQGKPTPIDHAWWDARLSESFSLRRELLQSRNNTGVRCINGENDGLPGLVVDKYETVAVVKIYTPAWLAHLETIVPLLIEHLGVKAVVLRLSRNTLKEAPEHIFDGMALHGAQPSGPVLFRENGLTVEADVVHGQKTGYFLDQRDNRRLVAQMCQGASVLDVFSAGGGFTVAAAAGGARSVLSVDISAGALEAVVRNLGHNKNLKAVQQVKHQTRRGDAFEIMASLAAARQRFDVVIVDPPSFAQKETSIPGALRAYARLTSLAVELLNNGGLLFQASCSSRVSPEEFFHTVEIAAKDAGVTLKDTRRTGHTSDHPIGFQFGEYLKALLARVHH